MHWVIVKDGQVESGISEALARVNSAGVLIEGNSFLDYVKPDLAVMCARSEGGKVKPSARRALMKSNLVYLSSLNAGATLARKQFEEWRARLIVDLDFNNLPIFTREDLPWFISLIWQRDALAGPLHPAVALQG